jgi:hypothetical protein
MFDIGKENIPLVDILTNEEKNTIVAKTYTTQFQRVYDGLQLTSGFRFILIHKMYNDEDKKAFMLTGPNIQIVDDCKCEALWHPEIRF